jgi:tetratricopeptide (TPR) repeat protein
MVTALAIGLLMQLFGVAFVDSAYIAVAAMAITYTQRAWHYCRERSEKSPTPDASGDNFSRRAFATWRAGAAVASWAAIGLVNIVSVTPAEAAIADRRLRKLTQGKTLSPDHARGIANILNTVAPSPMSLSDPTLARVRDAIKASEPNSATATAANALINYARAKDDVPRLIKPPKTPAERAYLEGGEHFVNAYSKFPEIDLIEANTAISLLSRCIELAEPDRTLRIDALFMRATLYLNLGKPSEALADAEDAESLGALDLASIVWVEATALVNRRSPGDLERAISLVTLGLWLKPPRWLVSESPLFENMYRVELLQRRSIAYYQLGAFKESAGDSKEALSIAPTASPEVLPLYTNLVAAHLKMGDVPGAEKAAREWIERDHDPRAQRVLAVLEANRSNPQSALAELVGTP